jgi:putative DNA primase/helicase
MFDNTTCQDSAPKVLRPAEPGSDNDSPSHNTDDRPTIKIIAGALPETVDRVEEILRETGGVYQRGEALVRIGKVVLPKVAGIKRAPFLGAVALTVDALIDDLTRRVYWERHDLKQKKEVLVNCPREVAATLLARTGQWTLPALHAITTAPTLRPDGSILDTPGFDHNTGIYYDPQGVEFPSVPENPTWEDARRDLDFLIDLVREVPFVELDEHGAINRAVFLSAFLTGLIRSALPFAPLHAWDAPVPGSGKTMLSDAIAIAQTGNPASVLNQGPDDEEMGKLVSAALRAGDGVIVLDNCTRPIKGDLLCQAVTSPIMSIRILGKTEKVKILNTALFMANGNNLVVSEDMLRRVLRSTIDPGVECPESRVFTTVRPDHLVDRDRAKYVIAGLTVLRAFHVAGRPQQAAATEGFDAWTRWVRDALIWLGEPDPWLVTEGTRQEDPERQKTNLVLREWYEVLPDTWVRTQDLMDKALGEAEIVDCGGYTTKKLINQSLKDALVAVADEGGGYINKHSLGIWISQHKQRIISGYQITAKIKDGYTWWRVSQASGEVGL